MGAPPPKPGRNTLSSLPMHRRALARCTGGAALTRSPRAGRVSPFVLGLLATGSAACSGTPAPPPTALPAHVDVTPAPAPPPVISAARWVRGGGATTLGPLVPAGQLVLLGGRRALVAKDGSVKVETAPAPEPILELALVPIGPGERRIVGRGAHGIYRFDDPLGAPALLARSEVELKGLGSGPGLVAVWDTQSELPRFLDLETGKPGAFPSLPALPVRAMAFRNGEEGAALFHAAGLATTTDGGASWRPVADTVGGDALRVNGLRLRGDEVRAFLYDVGRDALVDPAQAKLGTLDELPPAGDEPPLVRWIRTTGRDPLEAAITSGALSGPTQATVASHGLFARVDLKTGLVEDLAEFARGGGVNACAVGRAATAVWVGCALSEENEGDLYDPFGVVALPLTGKLVSERPVVARNGEAELRTSPSGGAMLLSSCNADEDGSACVRQPDGRWLTFKVDTDIVERGAGPLADGRMAFLRGLYEGDDPPASADAEGEGAPAGVRAPNPVVVAATGAAPRFAPSIWSGRASGDFRVASPIQEDADRALHFALDNEEGVFVFVQQHGGEGSHFKRQDGATRVRLAGDHGMAVGPRKVEATLDGGRSFSEVPAPRRVMESIERLGGMIDEPGVFVIGEVGAKVDSELRLGWGPAEPAPPEPALAGGSLLEPRPGAAPLGPEQALSCKAEGPAASTPPLLGSHQIRALLATTPAAPKGTRREITATGSGRTFEPIAVLEEQGPAKPGSTPATWTLRWHDPLEIGGKPHTWTGPPPKGMGWGASLRTVAASGGRAVFSIRAGGKYLLARTKPGGGLELLEVSFAELPSSDVVFGTDRGEPIAWLRETTLYVWLAGEAPRPIGSIAQQALRTLGQPTKDGVPVLVGASDWAAARTFAIPAKAADKAKDKDKDKDKDKGDKDKAGKDKRPPPPSLDGWVPVVNVRREAGRLPACADARQAPGAFRLSVARSALDVAVDALPATAQTALYEVRLTPPASGAAPAAGQACVTGLAALVSPARKAPPAGTTTTDKAAPKPVTFVRVDVAGKKAEGGERGLGGAGAVKKLACTLGGR